MELNTAFPSSFCQELAMKIVCFPSSAHSATEEDCQAPNAQGLMSAAMLSMTLCISQGVSWGHGTTRLRGQAFGKNSSGILAWIDQQYSACQLVASAALHQYGQSQCSQKKQQWAAAAEALASMAKRTFSMLMTLLCWTFDTWTRLTVLPARSRWASSVCSI